MDLFVDDFAEHPYRHRVEHSLHLQLYRALADHRQFDVLAPVGTSSLRAGLIHKEWPETLPGRDADRRGLFDLAVLAPSQLAQASIDQFRQGRIPCRSWWKWASTTACTPRARPREAPQQRGALRVRGALPLPLSAPLVSTVIGGACVLAVAPGPD